MAKKKGIPILISLDAHSSTDGRQEDPIRMITTGEMFERADETVIRYEESLDENDEPQKIELTMRGNVITMSRKGVISAEMVFSRGKRYESQYHTPYGDMDLALYCTRAEFTPDNSGGELALQYQLDLGGQYAAVHDMRLHWMRKKAT